MPPKPNYFRVRRDCKGHQCVLAEDDKIGIDPARLYWVRKPDTDCGDKPGMNFDFRPVDALVFDPTSPFTVLSIAPDKVTVDYAGHAEPWEWTYRTM